jgi:hypothetical protein
LAQVCDKCDKINSHPYISAARVSAFPPTTHTQLDPFFGLSKPSTDFHPEDGNYIACKNNGKLFNAAYSQSETGHTIISAC